MAADVMSSHTGWIENNDYTQSNRVTWTAGTAASRQIMPLAYRGDRLGLDRGEGQTFSVLRYAMLSTKSGHACSKQRGKEVRLERLGARLRDCLPMERAGEEPVHAAVGEMRRAVLRL